MTRQAKIILVSALLLIGGTAAFLGRIQAFQRMGCPGVKVVAQPVRDPEGNVVGTNRVELPEKVLDFTSEILPVERIVLNWLPRDTTFGQRVYTAADGFQASLNVVMMGTDRTSIHKPQYCLTGAGWVIRQTELTEIEIQQPYPYELPVVKLTLDRNVPRVDGTTELRRAIYIYWYVADGQLCADHRELMWLMARDMIREGIWQRWAYVACFSMCGPGQEHAMYERMKALIAGAVPEFQLATGRPLEPAVHAVHP